MGFCKAIDAYWIWPVSLGRIKHRIQTRAPRLNGSRNLKRQSVERFEYILANRCRKKQWPDSNGAQAAAGSGQNYRQVWRSSHTEAA